LEKSVYFCHAFIMGEGNMTDFIRKTVLITGAAHGIGKLMAEKIAGLGASLVICDVNREGLEKTAEELRRKGTTVFAHAFDISERQEVYDAAKAILKETGKVDILINNAGVVFTGEILSLSDEKHLRQVEINLLGTLWMIKAFLPDMVKRNDGHLVNIASSAGLLAIPGMGMYSATKHALMGLNEALRNELRNNNSKVRTTVVCPYLIKTGMFEGMKTPFWQPGLTPEAMADAVIKGILKNRKIVAKPWTVFTLPVVKALFPPAVMDTIASLSGFSKAVYSCNEFVKQGDNSYKAPEILSKIIFASDQQLSSQFKVSGEHKESETITSKTADN
jgi:all-trans-retinol dehydrogenase (NAD+)